MNSSFCFVSYGYGSYGLGCLYVHDVGYGFSRREWKSFCISHGMMHIARRTKKTIVRRHWMTKSSEVMSTVCSCVTTGLMIGIRVWSQLRNLDPRITSTMFLKIKDVIAVMARTCRCSRLFVPKMENNATTLKRSNLVRQTMFVPDRMSGEFAYSILSI